MNAAAILALAATVLAAPSPITAVSGEGGITAGWTADGVLAALRWPGPGGPNQLMPPDSGDTAGGGRWGMEARGGSRWIGGPGAQTTESRGWEGVAFHTTWTESEVEWLQQARIVPGTPALVLHIEVDGSPDEPSLLWRAEWTPSARRIPELPIDGPVQRLSPGFAPVWDEEAGRAWFYRPESPGRDDVRRAHELITEDARVDRFADAFGKGVWIGVGNLKRMTRASDATVFAPRVERLEDKWRARIVVAVGSSYAEASQALDTAEVWDIEAPVESSHRPVAESIVPAAHRDEFVRQWRVLEAMHDGSSGRFVRGLDSSPLQVRDFPRYGAWIAIAHTAAGDAATAETILNHYLSEVRLQDAPGRPFGSLPESFFTDGQIASPAFTVDDRGPARMLVAVDRLAESMDPGRRSEWLGRQANAIRAAADFLTVWADARRGAPLWSPDPLRLSDPVSQSRVFDQFAGISAAIRLVESMGGTPPDRWMRRREVLRDLTEWILVTPYVPWSPAGAILSEFDGLSAEARETAVKQTTLALGSIGKYNELQSARIAAQAAQLVENRVPGVEPESVWPAIRQAVGSGTSSPPSDSLAAALVIYSVLVAAQS